MSAIVVYGGIVWEQIFEGGGKSPVTGACLRPKLTDDMIDSRYED